MIAPPGPATQLATASQPANLPFESSPTQACLALRSPELLEESASGTQQLGANRLRAIAHELTSSCGQGWVRTALRPQAEAGVGARRQRSVHHTVPAHLALEAH